MAVINMKQTCEANGITEFSRTRGGWMKMIEGIDKSKKGGYSFIGDNFYKVGNFKTNIPNGIYLDQSTPVIDDEKTLTMNLFQITDGNVTLVQTVPKTNGWAEELWDAVDNYFHNQTEVTAQDIINTIKEMTDSETIIEEVISKLTSEKTEESSYPFKNWYEVKSMLTELEVIECLINVIEGIWESGNHQDDYVFKCKELTTRYPYKKYITSAINIFHHTSITEETHVDYRKITPTTFKSKFFQNEIKTKKYVQYLARTIPNATGYHNGIEVTIFYYENNTICIREFNYFFNTSKIGQIGREVLTP